MRVEDVTPGDEIRWIPVPGETGSLREDEGLGGYRTPILRKGADPWGENILRLNKPFQKRIHPASGRIMVLLETEVVRVDLGTSEGVAVGDPPHPLPIVGADPLVILQLKIAVIFREGCERPDFDALLMGAPKSDPCWVFSSARSCKQTLVRFLREGSVCADQSPTAESVTTCRSSALAQTAG